MVGERRRCEIGILGFWLFWGAGRGERLVGLMKREFGCMKGDGGEDGGYYNGGGSFHKRKRQLHCYILGFLWGYGERQSWIERYWGL